MVMAITIQTVTTMVNIAVALLSARRFRPGATRAGVVSGVVDRPHASSAENRKRYRI